jgi:hypothetical protein
MMTTTTMMMMTGINFCDLLVMKFAPFSCQELPVLPGPSIPGYISGQLNYPSFAYNELYRKANLLIYRASFGRTSVCNYVYID